MPRILSLYMYLLYIEFHCWGYPCKLSLTIQFSFTVNHFYYTRNLPGIYTSWCKTCILSNEILPNKNLYIKLQLLIRNLGEIQLIAFM